MFFFQHFKDIVLSSLFSDEMLAIIFTLTIIFSYCFPVCHVSFLLWLHSWFSLLSFVFSLLTMVCLYLVFFVWILLGVLWPWICGLISFISLRKFSVLLSCQYLCPILSYASEIPIIFMLNCLLLYQRAYMLGYGFHFFLFMLQLCFCWPVCYQVYWFFYYVQSADKPIKIILHL